MDTFINWLYATPLSQFIQRAGWIIPAAQIVHILCLALIFAAMAMLDLRLLGVSSKSDSVATLARRFIPWVWRALPIMLLTGLILITAEPNRQLQNTAFYLKMILLLLVVLLTLGLERVVIRDPLAWQSKPTYAWPARAIGATSLLLWAAIIACGRLIAYT